MRSGGRRQIDEIDCFGGPTQFFLDDRPAAPCERIGHYQWPCTHLPASILIHPQYRIFANIAYAIHLYLAETFRPAAEISAHAPPCGYSAPPCAPIFSCLFAGEM